MWGTLPTFFYCRTLPRDNVNEELQRVVPQELDEARFDLVEPGRGGTGSGPIAPRCIRANTGVGACDFVSAVKADLLAVPMETKSGTDARLPRQSAWITDVIPCNLWIIR